MTRFTKDHAQKEIVYFSATINNTNIICLLKLTNRIYKHRMVHVNHMSNDNSYNIVANETEGCQKGQKRLIVAAQIKKNNK